MRIQEVLAQQQLGYDAASLVVAFNTNLRVAKYQIMRCWRPGCWNPPVRVAGRQHVEEALAAGHGAILWVAPMVFAPLVTKIALDRAGFAVCHLSRFSHGFSSTRFGARWLNGVRTRVEDRFLAERVIIGPDRFAGPALKHLRSRLQENQVVSITVGASSRKTYDAPFLEGSVRLASGAVALARSTGARLLPVFTVRDDSGGFVSTVEPPLEPSVLTSHEAAVAARFGHLLERYARRWPDQLDWTVDIIKPRHAHAKTSEP